MHLQGAAWAIRVRAQGAPWGVRVYLAEAPGRSSRAQGAPWDSEASGCIRKVHAEATLAPRTNLKPLSDELYCPVPTWYCNDLSFSIQLSTKNKCTYCGSTLHIDGELWVIGMGKRTESCWHWNVKPASKKTPRRCDHHHDQGIPLQGETRASRHAYSGCTLGIIMRPAELPGLHLAGS